MGDVLLAPHLVESLKATATEILETMVSMTPQAVEQVTEERSEFNDQVIGLLGFTGTRSGTFLVRTTEAMACRIAAKMLMMEADELADFAEAADAFGEVVNMLSGNFKNAWVAEGNQMDLSIPNVIHNGHVLLGAERRGGVLRSGVRVTLDGGALDIGVHFEG
ncbi:MAG: chemotaxis protein CheX [Planctomycetes bacterium]|nr:chemotaxis protein CheX [Planctomycetota bacterium]MCC7396760.1 chemotaxis protein CheX [Planctomycetota bacterium]